MHCLQVGLRRLVGSWSCKKLRPFLHWCLSHVWHALLYLARAHAKLLQLGSVVFLEIDSWSTLEIMSVVLRIIINVSVLFRQEAKILELLADLVMIVCLLLSVHGNKLTLLAQAVVRNFASLALKNVWVMTDYMAILKHRNKFLLVFVA